jgi:class 3 adenylate cyclase
VVELRQETLDDRAMLLVQCHNASKQKEAEYMLDSYSRMAEKNARELQKEKERVEKLLLNIMPRSVYEEMKDLGTATPQRFDSASVLMLDFVDFTDMAISRDPSALIAELNDIFSAFDRISDLFECERIKTMGDAYLAVSGLPEANAEHAASIAKVALRMRRYLVRRNASHPTQWNCRIGIATGPVIGSLVGIQKYVYDVFGPAPNLAARLESLSAPMQITLSEDTYALIRDDFIISERGRVEVKGFGTQTLYTLDGQTGSKV